MEPVPAHRQGLPDEKLSVNCVDHGLLSPVFLQCLYRGSVGRSRSQIADSSASRPPYEADIKPGALLAKYSQAINVDVIKEKIEEFLLSLPLGTVRCHACRSFTMRVVRTMLSCCTCARVVACLVSACTRAEQAPHLHMVTAGPRLGSHRAACCCSPV